MKTITRTVRGRNRICAHDELANVPRPALAQLVRVLWAALFALPALGTQAGVVFTNLYSFTGTNDGAYPYAGLLQAKNGYLNGTTASGGTNGGFGTVFKMSTNGAFTSLYSFTGGNDGGGSDAELVNGSDGNFYGATSSGGTNNFGTVFKISASGALTSLHSFSGTNDGANPYEGLVQGKDGFLYGTTELGGTNNYGTVFKISTNGALTRLYSFTGGNDGGTPIAGLVQASDGKLYGTTYNGGTNSSGTVFKITTNGALTSLYAFTGSNDGASPFAGLVQASDGYLYGTASSGGTNNSGTVFKINTNGALSSLYTFTGGDDGATPYAGLVQGSDGYLYGTTGNGGTNNSGAVFKISTNGALTSLYVFSGGTNDGGIPFAKLVQGSDGGFYGTTVSGGLGAGTIFRLSFVTVRAAPAFQAVTLTNHILSLTWSTVAGGVYQLEYNTNLSSRNWTNLGTAVTAAGAVLSATDSVTNAPQRFYRVALLP